VNPDDIARILDDLGNRLGPAGEYVFALSVRYVVTDAILGLAFGAIAAVIAVVAARWASRQQYEEVLLGYLLAGVLGAIAALFGFLNLRTLLNPEYAAIRDILSRVIGS
jgi:hypothetical protein